MRKGKRRFVRSKIIAVCITVFAIVLIMIIVGIENRVEPKIRTLCTYYCQSRLNEIIVNSVNEAVEENSITYSDIANKKTTGGKLSSIEIKSENVSRLLASIVSKSNESIEEFSQREISVPVGSITDSFFLSGKGFDVKLKFVLGGGITANLKNDFSSGGLNQTCHRIIAEVTAKGVIILPSGNIDISTSVDCPISESIILGEVPQGIFR